MMTRMAGLASSMDHRGHHDLADRIDALDHRISRASAAESSDPKTGLTETESEVMDALILAWNKFQELGETHADFERDFRDAIHRAQSVMFFRIVRRDYPGEYND